MMRLLLARASKGLACASSTRSNGRPRLKAKTGVLLSLGAAAAAGCGLQVAADASESSDGLPTDKLACHMGVAAPCTPTVLVSCGSFNPPTIMHLRMFDLATAALAKRGYDVWGCYMSPVADAYGKKGLAPVHDRLQMCQLAAAGTSNLMVDSWEAQQPGYTRTVQVLRRVSGALQSYMQEASSHNQASKAHAAGLAAAAAAASPAISTTSPVSKGEAGPPGQHAGNNRHHASSSTNSSNTDSPSSSSAGSSPSSSSSNAQPSVPVPRVMLLCGADLLATLGQPGVWQDPDVILRDYGIVCVCRAGTDLHQLLDQPGSLLNEYRANIVVVEEPVPNDVSSTKVRQLLAAGEPVRHLVPDAVISYIQSRGLYTCV